MVSLQDLDKVSQRIKTGQLQAVKALHLVAYGTEAPPRQARKRVCEFRGFNLDKESDEFENKLSDVEEFELCDLVAVCNLLDLDYSGAKKEVVSRVCDFLNNLSSEDQNEKERRTRKIITLMMILKFQTPVLRTISKRLAQKVQNLVGEQNLQMLKRSNSLFP